MTSTINISETLAQAHKMRADNKDVPADFLAMFSVLLTALEGFLEQQKPTSRNSSLPPSQDPNRLKKLKSGESDKKPGGQAGHVGKTLRPVENPDEIINISVDKSSLPQGHSYKQVGVSKRQVVEFHLSRHVKEYHLEILENKAGKRITAIPPDEPAAINRPIQYGVSIKAMAVYMNQYQLVPYKRVAEYFRDQGSLPLSPGSLFKFNKEAFSLLENFENIAREKLLNACVLHSDETGINVNGKLHWLHAALNDRWSLLMPHTKRGTEAMNEMDILPHFNGISVHDHWKPYFTYTKCRHALCNAHHLRELQGVVEKNPDHKWAAKMKDLLLEINEAVAKAGGVLIEKERQIYRKRYRKILKEGDGESPLPIPPQIQKGQAKKRGRMKKTKERNLLERLRIFEKETLLFMEEKQVPFTNNKGENDIRMTKVHQKISGCFKSFEGALIFCRVRSFLLTAQKHGVTATDALNTLFQGKLPDFCHP
jgi:transposase